MSAIPRDLGDYSIVSKNFISCRPGGSFSIRAISVHQ